MAIICIYGFTENYIFSCEVCPCDCLYYSGDSYPLDYSV